MRSFPSPLVRDFVEVRLVAAHGLRLALKPPGCFDELLASPGLNHGVLPFPLVIFD